MAYPVGEFRASRRAFLKGVAMAGGTVAIACVADTALAESEPVASALIKERQRGYQVTPHVREYYEKARF